MPKPAFHPSIVFVISLLLMPSLRSANAQGTSIEGLWGTEIVLGAPVAGQLTIDGRRGKWLASIDGYTVSASLSDGILTFSLPGDKGAFRGHPESTKQELEGKWIQPSGLILDSKYASPVSFRRVLPKVWRGNVVPLQERFSAYLLISLKDGKLSAVASNPEGNFFRRRVYQVTQQGNSVLLEANGKKFAGTYDDESKTLTIQLADWLPVFRLTRRTSKDAVGYYPRLGEELASWKYRKPLPRDDGWAVSDLQREGVSEPQVAKLIEHLLQADPADTSLRTQSLLIARHGKLVLEEYFYGFSQDRVHDMRSAGKTFAPVLVGLARKQGVDIRPATLVYPLFAQEGPFANLDDRKTEMKLRDIMTMTAGNACDDEDDASPGSEDRMQSDPRQPDGYKYTLDLPMKTRPGGAQAVYCSGDLNLVGGAVAATTHAWLPDFFEEHLARPLQFGKYYLNLMPNGQAYMGGGAYLLPRDQLKLGQLYLDRGVWNGRRLVDSDWVKESTSLHAEFARDRSLSHEHGYGFGWHLHHLQDGNHGKVYEVFAAEGNGGQFVIVVPVLDMVIGITGGAYGEFDQWYRWELELVPHFILPAVEGLP